MIEPSDSQDTTDEKLYGIMEKSVRLLEMGFSENQVSIAIEKFGKSLIPFALLDLKKRIK